MKRVAVMIILFFLTVQPAWAEDTVLRIPGMDELLDYGESYQVTANGGLDGGISGLLQQASDMMAGLLKQGFSIAVRLLVVVVVCAFAQGAVEAGAELLPVTRMAGALAITALSVGEVGGMVSLGRETIRQMDDFSQLLLPVMATVTAATGNISSAAVRQGATMLFSTLLIQLIDRLLLPLVYAYVAACCGYAALGNEGLKRVAGLIKGVVNGTLTVFLLIYVAYLSISGAIAGTTDAAVVKAAKLAMSRAIPVVGGILSDAAETVLAGAGLLKGTVGVVGLIVVLTICLAPFLHLAVHYLTYKLTAALAGTVADVKLTGLIEDISSAFGLVLGMTGSCALILLISMVSGIAAVLS